VGEAIARAFPHREEGTGLIEAIVALAAGAVILGATLQSIASFQRQFVTQQAELADQQDLRVALEVLEQELRLASVETIENMKPDEIAFGANVHGYMTTMVTPAAAGQAVLSVENGRGWPAGKAIAICWNESCERSVLAKDGQVSLLSLSSPLLRAVPAGSGVSVVNRLRYYSKPDERGVLRFMRQVDGGAATLVGAIKEASFTYWDDAGAPANWPAAVKRVVLRIKTQNSAIFIRREFSLRS
jgi:hypothetical protein